jgi:hypothetical protein
LEVSRSGAKQAVFAIGTAALMLICVPPPCAHAKGSSDGQGDEATANARFDEGRLLMEHGDVARACPKFAESERLLPSGRAVFNLGECYEKLGKYASALAAFEEALRRARAAKKTEIAELTLKRVVALSPKVSRLAIESADKAQIKVDGEIVVLGNLGPEGLAVDPGEHVITASAPQKKTFTKTVFFTEEKSTQHVSIPPLEDVEPGSKGEGKTGGGTTASGGFPWRTVGIVGGSAGVVVAGVGIALGLAAQSRLDHVRAVCPQGPNNTLVCSSDELKQRETDNDLNPAVNLANTSTILIVSGAVLAAAGLTIALVDPFGGKKTASVPPPPKPTARFALTPFGAAVFGQF